MLNQQVLQSSLGTQHRPKHLLGPCWMPDTIPRASMGHLNRCSQQPCKLGVFFCVSFLHLFLREREREKQGRGRERETQNPKQLQALR